MRWEVVVGIVVDKGAYRNLLRATTKLLRKETSKELFQNITKMV